MTTKTKAISTNGNAIAVEIPRAAAKKPVMEMPAHLALNLDAVDIDDVFMFADPDTAFQRKKEFMDRIVVGGIGKYHFTLLVDLAEVISQQLFEALPGSKKKKSLSVNS